MEDLHDTRPEDETTRWPKVIGTISLIYAIGGFLCVGVSVVNVFLGEFFAKMGGLDIEMPGILKVIGVIGGIFGVILGILMISGSVALLRRRAVGVARLKAWAVLRLILLVIMTTVGIVTLPAQMDMQRTIIEYQNDQMAEAGRRDMVQPFDEDAIWRRGVIFTGVFGGLAAIYPLFLGFYLSRKRINDEVSGW